MSKQKIDNSIARDITRRVYADRRMFYSRAFETYALERIDQIAALDEIPELPDSPPGADVGTYHPDYYPIRDARARTRHERYEAAHVEVARALNLRYATLRGFRGSHTLTDEERIAFAEWEAASRRLEPVRAFVAAVRELPTEDRSAVLAAWEDLDERAKHEMKGALDEYLVAADIADRMRHLLSSAASSANAVYAAHVATEPVVALAAVAETEPPEAARPLIDTGSRRERKQPIEKVSHAGVQA